MTALNIIEFRVPGRPRAAPRPRVKSKGGVYYPQWYTDAKDAISTLARQAMIDGRHSLLVTPVEVRLVFSGARGNEDIDNLCKTVLDGLTRMVYDDDRRVAKLVAVRMPLGLAKNFTKITVLPFSYVQIQEPEAVDALEAAMR